MTGRSRIPAPVLLSYAAFVLVGLNSGVSGVLLLAQMRGYGVDRAVIGLTFLTGSAGFVVAGLCSGPLISRFGVRATLAAGGLAYLLADLYLATRPPFAAFLLVQLAAGYGLGILESALNAYLASLPDATNLLNRLHGFFGVGALVGPVLATWILGFASWTVVWLILALAAIPLTAGFLAAYPGPEPAVPPPAEASQVPARPAAGGLLSATLRQPGVLLGAAMLAVYVGLEISVGSWAFSYLLQARVFARPLAGYSVSGYWLGLTLGRFLISPAAARIGATTTGMMYACLAGVTAATVAWLSPAPVLASVALVLLGFFLGPVFPTIMAVTPRLTQGRLAATAIGVMNAAAVVGGAGLPWLAGAIAQRTGISVLPPFALALALAQFLVWLPLARRLRPAQADAA